MWSWKLIQKNSNGHVCHENYDEEMKEKKSWDIPVDYVITNTTNKMIVNIHKFYLKSGFLATAILSSATSEDLILCHFI